MISLCDKKCGIWTNYYFQFMRDRLSFNTKTYLCKRESKAIITLGCSLAWQITSGCTCSMQSCKMPGRKPLYEEPGSSTTICKICNSLSRPDRFLVCCCLQAETIFEHFQMTTNVTLVTLRPRLKRHPQRVSYFLYPIAVAGHLRRLEIASRCGPQLLDV